MRRASVLLRLSSLLVLIGLSPLTVSASSPRPVHASPSIAWQKDPRQVAQRAADAINTQNWATLYSLTWPQLRANTTEAEFEKIVTDPAQPQIVSVRLSGTGTQSGVGDILLFAPAADASFAQPVTVQARTPDGSLVTFSINMYLVRDKDKDLWYLFSTDAPPSF